MEGENVEIILHTVILVSEADSTNKNQHLEPVLKLKGKVLSCSKTGISLEITECLTEKNQKLVPPHRKIFLPMHKIDHVYVL